MIFIAETRREGSQDVVYIMVEDQDMHTILECEPLPHGQDWMKFAEELAAGWNIGPKEIDYTGWK